MAEDRAGALSPIAAVGVIGGIVALAAVIGRKGSPTPDHPATRRWYERLDKPAFTPPAPVFAIAWPLIETGLAVGAYRLLRRPSSPARNGALAILGANQAGLAGWSQLFFGERALGAGTVASGLLGASAAGYVAVAAKEDKAAAATALPLVGWLAFATVLAGSLWRRQPEEDRSADLLPG